jgi:hypothetical protein
MWRYPRRKIAIVCGLFFIFFYCFENFEWVQHVISFPKFDQISTTERAGIVPEELLGTVYSSSDFVNDRGIRPPFWNCEGNRCNITSEWGPCYASHEEVTWSKEVEFFTTNPPSYTRVSYMSKSTDLAGLCRPGFIIIGAGKCGTRYGFSIAFNVIMFALTRPHSIRSSLYHYLVDHPSVLPASEKQIHYFKVSASRLYQSVENTI